MSEQIDRVVGRITLLIVVLVGIGGLILAAMIIRAILAEPIDITIYPFGFVASRLP